MSGDGLFISQRSARRLSCWAASFGWLGCWAVTTLIVGVGAMFGVGYVNRASDPVGFWESLARIDGRNYRQIADDGYTYQEGVPSAVAFFPAYPLSARWLGRLTGWGTLAAQLLISNGFCLAAFTAMSGYLRHRKRRLPAAPNGAGSPPGAAAAPAMPGDVDGYALLAMGLLPTTFFFRMAYTESMFLCLSILTLYGIARRWPAAAVAVVVGLATAVRPVGMALLLPLTAYVWREAASRGRAARRLLYILPLGCWGLLAYMVFLQRRFGQPLAFALTQKYHRVRPIDSAMDQVLALLSWEPIRDIYNPVSSGYWQAIHSTPSALFSLEFANPIFFLATAGLIGVGVWRRHLTVDEILLALPLIFIPYFTRAYEMRMLSQARFAAVVFPVYIVLGHVLARLPHAVAAALLALSGFLMGAYAALFAAGHPLL